MIAADRAAAALLFAVAGRTAGARLELQAGDDVVLVDAERPQEALPWAMAAATDVAVVVRPVLRRTGGRPRDRLWVLWLVATHEAAVQRLAELPTPGLLLADGATRYAVWPLAQGVDRRRGLEALRLLAIHTGTLVSAIGERAALPIPGSVGEHGRVECMALDVGRSISARDLLPLRPVGT